MNNLKKISNVLFVTLLVLSVGFFAGYSKTASKYMIDDTKDNIVNSIGFKSLVSNFTPSLEIIGEKARFTVNFYRTIANNDSSVKKDEITFKIDNTDNDCKIISITGFKGNEKTLNAAENIAVLNYKDVTSNTDETSKVKVVYECSADKIITQKNGKDYLKTKYYGFEQIDDEAKFKYFGGVYISDEEYIKPVGYVISDDKKKLTLVNSELTDAILNEWFLAYTNEYFAQFNSSNGAFDNLKNYLNFNTVLTDPNSIEGLSYNEANKQYELNDAVMSYAFTNSFSINDLRLYFLNLKNKNLDATEVNKMFEHYYDEYYRGRFNDTENKEILKYIADNGGISSVVIDGNNISGIVNNNYYLTIDMDIIMAKLYPVNPEIVLDFDKYPPTNMPKLLEFISSSISDYAKKTFNLSVFNDKIIELNYYLDTYLSNIKDNANTYFYIPVEDKMLSVRVYNDGKNYKIHLDDSIGHNIGMEAEKHLFTPVSAMFQTSTDVADYAQLKSQYMYFVRTIDSEYGTTFEKDGAEKKFNNLINLLISRASSGETIFQVNNYLLEENTKHLSLSLNYYSDGVSHSSMAVEFVPPVPSETPVTPSASESQTNASNESNVASDTINDVNNTPSTEESGAEVASTEDEDSNALVTVAEPTVGYDPNSEVVSTEPTIGYDPNSEATKAEPTIGDAPSEEDTPIVASEEATEAISEQINE